MENINESNNFLFINDFLNSLDKYIITEKDFYSKKSNNKFKLYKYIHSIFLKNDKSCNNNYFRQSNIAINNLYDNLIQLKINYEDALSLKDQIDEEDFKEKLKIIYRDTKLDFIYKQLKESIIKIDNYHNKLLKAKNFYKFFYELSEKDFRKEIEEKIKMLKKSEIIITLNDLESFFNNPKYKYAEKYNKIYKSKFFMVLFEENKKNNPNENEKDIFEKTIDSFVNLKILNNWKENNKINTIPNYEIISNTIETIIKENVLDGNGKANKNKCISLISKELEIIEDIYKKQKNNSLEVLDNSLGSNLNKISKI